MLPVLGTGAGRARIADVFSRAPREETIRDAKLDLVCIGDRVDVVEANDAIEVVDALKLSIDHVRLDHVTKEEFAVTTKVSRKSGRPHVELKLTISSRHVAAENVARRWIE